MAYICLLEFSEKTLSEAREKPVYWHCQLNLRTCSLSSSKEGIFTMNSKTGTRAYKNIARVPVMLISTSLYRVVLWLKSILGL